MVSSVLHVLRGNADPFSVLAAGSLSYFLFGLMGKSGTRAYVAAVLAFSPLLLLPDFKLSPQGTSPGTYEKRERERGRERREMGKWKKMG
jgi:hypothetical protein